MSAGNARSQRCADFENLPRTTGDEDDVAMEVEGIGRADGESEMTKSASRPSLDELDVLIYFHRPTLIPRLCRQQCK